MIIMWQILWSFENRPPADYAKSMFMFIFNLVQQNKLIDWWLILCCCTHSVNVTGIVEGGCCSGIFSVLRVFNWLCTRVAPNLTFSNSAGAEFGRISELKFGRSRSQSRIWLKLVFWSQNNTPVIKLLTSTMLSAAIEAVHSSASFVALLFASYFW